MHCNFVNLFLSFCQVVTNKFNIKIQSLRSEKKKKKNNELAEEQIGAVGLLTKLKKSVTN